MLLLQNCNIESVQISTKSLPDFAKVGSEILIFHAPELAAHMRG